MNYIRGAESGPENGSGIRPQKWSRNPARILFFSADFESFFGLAAGSWCAFPGEHMRFGLALVITPAPLLCGNSARSNLVRPGFVGLERFMQYVIQKTVEGPTPVEVSVLGNSY